MLIKLRLLNILQTTLRIAHKGLDQLSMQELSGVPL